MPIALTIAGSDSGGGAGVQADLKTFQAFGVFGTSAIPAVTAQNTLGVHAVHPVPVDLVQAQIDAVATDLRPAALKTGMLATAELVTAVAQRIEAHALENLVVDPVMVSTSGHPLLESGAQAAVIDLLIPAARLVTPNIPEAELLTARSVADEADMLGAARELVGRGAGAALIKGGHLEGAELIDLLWDGEQVHRWVRPRVATRHTHGTGCTLSAAACAGLARGDSVIAAVSGALDYVAAAIAQAPGLGAGHGPLDFGSPEGGP